MQILFRRRNHKEEHFERLFAEMYPRLVRFATTLMSNTEEAKDIVSETMEQAWKEFDQLKENTRSAWLYATVRNGCLNRLKHFECGTATHRPPHRSHPCGNESGLPRTRGTVAASGKHSPQFARTDLHHLAKLLLGEKNISTGSRRIGNQPRHREKTYIKSIADSARSDTEKGG